MAWLVTFIEGIEEPDRVFSVSRDREARPTQVSESSQKSVQMESQWAENDPPDGFKVL